MNKILIHILLVLIMIALVAPLMASNAEKSSLPSLLLIFSPLLVAVATNLTNKLFKKLNIDIEDSILDGIFAELFRLIAGAEAKKGSLSAEERFTWVVDNAYSRLPKARIKLLEKRFGSVENAVQAAFEQSSVSRKSSSK